MKGLETHAQNTMSPAYYCVQQIIVFSNLLCLRYLLPDKSLLERYMIDQPVYYKPYDERIITKLLNNYRSHPAILELPNRLFYDGELNVFADPLMRESFCDWEKLPSKDFPIIFHGIIGRDMREERSPSFFNPEEVSVVHDYVKSLLQKKRGIKVNPKDIGIISPYRKQVQYW